MPRAGRRDPLAPPRDASAKKPVPHAFALDELEPLEPTTRPMFGCLAVYVGEKIVFILRDKGPGDSDSGVWLSFVPEQQAALLARFPRLRPIDVFGDKIAGWKKLAAKDRDFEDDVLAACALVREGSPLIGKIPGSKKKKKPVKAKEAPAEKAPAKAKAAKKAPAKKTPARKSR